MINVNDFYFVNFNPRVLSEHRQEHYFRVWRETWVEAYRFFGWEPTIYSDHWTRQDSIGVLLYRNEFVGSVFFKEYDFTLNFTKQDSCFRMWPEAAFSTIGQHRYARRCLVCSWFTLNKKWRKGERGLDARYLIAALGVGQFLRSDYQMMVGCAVVKSRMNQTAYMVGAECLAPNVEEKGLMVDILSWQKSKMQDFKFPSMSSQIHKILDRTQVQQRSAA